MSEGESGTLRERGQGGVSHGVFCVQEPAVPLAGPVPVQWQARGAEGLGTGAAPAEEITVESHRPAHAATMPRLTGPHAGKGQRAA